jgi:SNF2 family DNA or RNA helicase
MSRTVIYICRRVKSDVDLQIPPKKEVLVYCPLTTRQKEIYKVGYIYGLQPVRK